LISAARRGQREAKAAVGEVCAKIAGNPFIFRTDVKSYYASIDHGILLAQIRNDWPRLLWRHFKNVCFGFMSEMRRQRGSGGAWRAMFGAGSSGRLEG